MHVHDYSVSRLRNKAVGKDHQVSNFVDDAIKLSEGPMEGGKIN